MVSPVRPVILSISERVLIAPLGESNRSIPGVRVSMSSPSRLTSTITPTKPSPTAKS